MGRVLLVENAGKEAPIVNAFLVWNRNLTTKATNETQRSTHRKHVSKRAKDVFQFPNNFDHL